MDISKQPIKADQAPSPNIAHSGKQKIIITDIQELKLEAGKVYAASVVRANIVQAKDSNTTSEQTLKIPSNIANPESKPGDPKVTVLESKEWLIAVKGKLALISSEKNLEIGQKLLLKIEAAGINGKANLIAQLVNNTASLNSSAPASNLSQIGGVTQTNPSPGLTNQANEASLKILLQALSFTLDKQLPLQQGFQQLTQILGKLENNAINKENLHLFETIKKNLVSNLPKLTEIISPSNQTKNTQGQIIKQSLLDSGLFLEKKLLSQPEKLMLFKEKIIAFDNALSLQNPAKTNTVTTSKASNLLEAYSPAIQKIQQTIDKLLQLSAHHSNVTDPKNTGASPTRLNDLKADLIALSSSVSKQLSSELSEAELKSIFTSSITDDFLPSPFAFPVISNTHTRDNTKALFDKQDVSAGQILKLLAGMIHKLQFNQLHSLLQSSTGNENALQQTWFFELPILNTNQSVQTFNFRIDKEPDDSSKEETNAQEQAFQWKLLLSFDLDLLGPIYVLVKLSQNKISSELWADKVSTLALLKQESAYFKQQLEKIGLDVGEVLCKKGQPHQTTTKLDRHLVDTKA